MKRRLYMKLFIGYLLLGLLALVVFNTFTQYMTQQVETSQEANNLNRMSTQLANHYLSNYYSQTTSLDDLRQQLSAIAAYLSAEIWIADASGGLLINTGDNSTYQGQEEPEPIQGFDINDFGDSYYMTGNFYGQFPDEVLTVYSSIIGNSYDVRGYVLIHKPMEDITKDTNQYMNVSFITAGILYLCAFLLLVIFSFSVYLPLRRIADAATSYAKGNFSKRIDVHSNDELGYLAATLNYMAAELSMREEDHRSFISNVSHDFRSPLTSIKGYVEAMQDGTIPPEAQEKYLNIILNETKRLHKLTESLLDLNRFGEHGILLDIRDFDINSVIRTTVLTFEGICAKRSLSFDLVLTGEELFVTGDRTKLQRVLYNLIDNAVKFSYPDTSIKLETSVINEKVLVSVKDSGIGIPSDSIGKIWERFYKTDLSRGKDKQGTGLGLAIVKEILQAHGEHINVVSTEGVGTEFIFSLPLAH